MLQRKQKLAQKSVLRIFTLSAVWIGSQISVQAEKLPELRPGLWQYSRTVQRSDQNWEARDTVVRECSDPSAQMKKQQETFEQRGCVVSTTETAEAAYRTVAECETKQGTKFTSRAVTTFNGDSAYTSVIDSEGVIAGKTVQFVERLAAKRVGDCEQK